LLKELLTAEQLLALHAATEYWRAIYVREQKGIVQIAVLLGEAHLHSPTGVDQGLRVVQLFENCLHEGVNLDNLPQAQFYKRKFDNLYRNLQNAIFGPIYGWTQASLIYFVPLAHAIADLKVQKKTSFLYFGKRFELVDLSRLMRRNNMGDTAKLIEASESLAKYSIRSVDCLETGYAISDLDLKLLRKIVVFSTIASFITPLLRGAPSITRWLSKVLPIPYAALSFTETNIEPRDHCMHSAIERRAEKLQGQPELVIFGAVHLYNVGKLLESSGWTKIMDEKPTLNLRKRKLKGKTKPE
ncbi:MAG: hypothetical protein KDD56_10895, partial [Bdellovibrionales bacterium]|nr:hypothetical protein [Bdellovibrionales bacterium]